MTRTRPSFCPQLEALESRWLPSTLLHVTNTLDSGKGSLRYEIAQAEKGNGKETIDFNLSKSDPGYNPSAGAWTIRLTSGELDIATNLTIQGPGAGFLTVSGDNLSRVFEVAPNVTVALSGMTISNGDGYAGVGPLQPNDGDGGGILNLGTLTLSGCTVSDNAPGIDGYLGNGGGIWNGGTLTVSGCTVSGNAAYYGGGIFNGGTLTVLDSIFSGNSPDDIYGYYTDEGGNTFG